MHSIEKKRCSLIKGGVPPFWASYLFHVKMTLINAPGSWATLGQKLRSLLQNEGKDILFSLTVGNFDKFCSFFTIGLESKQVKFFKIFHFFSHLNRSSFKTKALIEISYS